MSNSKKLGIPVFVVCAFVVGLAKPFSGLAPQGHYIIAVILISFALWIFKTDSIFYIAGGVLFIAGCLIFKLPLAAITIGYTSSAIWVLIPALFFGFALLKTGLGKRIAYFVLKTFEPSYFTICISWFIIGLILSALTPSITVRFFTVMPIVMSLTSIFGMTGISDWARPLMEPGILSLAVYPLVFLLVITIIFWAIRFVDVPWGYTAIALFSPILVPLYEKFCFHPVLVSVALIAAGNSSFLAYQQPFIMIGDTMTKSRGRSGGHVALGDALCAIAVLAGLCISSFYWRARDLMPG